MIHKLLLNSIILLFFAAGAVSGQSVIVNEYNNEAFNTREWVELFTTEAVDLRGFQLRDFSSSGNPQTPLIFKDADFWTNIEPGVLILVAGTETSFGEDLDPADGILIVQSNNSTLFSGDQFSIAGSSEAIQVLDPAGNHVHGLSYGTANEGSLPSPRAHIDASLDTGQSAGFFGTGELSNFSNGFFAKVFNSITPSNGNDPDNASFISELFFSNKGVPQILISSGNNPLEQNDILKFSKPGETKILLITNTGRDTLTISNVLTSGNGFSDSFDTAIQILPDSALSLEVTFTPPFETTQIFSGQLTIESNAIENGSFTLNLESRPELGKDDTFEIVTWNIEWFGSTSNGPSDEDLQRKNAAAVIKNIDADVFALQEITSNSALQALVNELDGYRGFIANHISIQQKTAYIYKTTTVDSLSAAPVQQGQNIDDWAQRLPFSFRLAFKVADESQTFTIINIHAKASTGSFGDREESYFKRVRAADALNRYIIDERPNDYIIIAGDYNDDVDRSIFDNRSSPYDMFINDSRNFRIVTSTLSDQKEQSTVGFSDMIDHITMSDELFNTFLVESQEVFPADNLISNYGSTTSDHFPVLAGFDFSGNFTSTDTDEKTGRSIPKSIALNQNFPNPFNPSTTIAFNIDQSSQVSLKIYDILGREVSQPIQNQRFNAGRHQINFNASNLSSGVYMYRLSVEGGPAITRKMTLIK